VLGLLLFAASSTAEAASAQSTTPNLTVLYDVSLGQHYSIYGSVIHHANVIVSGNIVPINAPAKVTVVFRFNFIGVTGIPATSFTLSSGSGQSSFTTMVVTLPNQTSSFQFTVIGSFVDTSFLYRDAASVPPISVAMSVPPGNPDSEQVRVLVTPQTEIVSTYPGPSQGTVIQTVNEGGETFLVAPSGAASSGLLVLYQAPYRDWFLVAYLVLIVVFVAISVPLLALIRKRGVPSVRALWRGVVGVTAWFTYKRLLALFVLASLLLIAVALVFGPSPTPKVYLAATPATAARLGPAITGAGYTFLTPSEAADQVNTLSNLGVFRAIVIADYPPGAPSQELDASFDIIVLNDSTPASPPASYMNQVRTLYPNFVFFVNSNQSLETLLASQRIGYVGNNLGLPVGSQVYTAAVTFEAVLCLFVPFFGLAFVARYLIESEAGVPTKIAMALAMAVLIFVFGEMAFIQTAVLLGIPVALHASISSLETAGGILGFGGGSRPREVMGFLGFIFGVLAGTGGKIKVDRLGIIAFIAVVLFLVTDPLSGGIVFYQLSLFAGTSVGVTAVGTAANNGVESFMNIFMNLFGALKSQVYYSQHGTVLFFAGITPFAIYTRLHKTTATFLALFSAAVAGLGYIRIANQDLDIFKVVASALPGFTIGLLLIGGFFGVNLVEGYLRRRLVAS
jgi:hypothetical protein